MMMHANDTMSDECFGGMRKRFTAYIQRMIHGLHSRPTGPVDMGGSCHVPSSLTFFVYETQISYYVLNYHY